MAEPAGQLDYARLRRRVGRRVLALLVLALAAGAAAYRYREPAVAKARFLVMEQRCLREELPPGQVVYSEDPADIAALAGTASGLGTYELHEPRPVYPYLSGYPRVAFRSTILTRHPLVRTDPGMAYAHGRRTPSGRLRLVVVGVSQVGDLTVGLFPRPVAPAGLRSGPAKLPAMNGLVIRRSTTDVVKVFAGRSDPGDASRFSIEVAVNGTRSVVDGQLRDDDGVVLTPRGEPVAPKYGGRTLEWIPAGSDRGPSHLRHARMPWVRIRKKDAGK